MDAAIIHPGYTAMLFYRGQSESLDQRVMLHWRGDDDRRVLAALRHVNRGGAGEHGLVEFVDRKEDGAAAGAPAPLLGDREPRPPIQLGIAPRPNMEHEL